MRYIHLVFLIVICNLSFAQKSTESFKGEMVFKESHYHESITRKLTDTVHTYFKYEVSHTIDIRQTIRLSESSWEEINYETITPLVINDSIIYRYTNAEDSLESYDIKMFPLSYDDTIKVVYCYRVRNNTCEEDEYELATYRQQDTTIVFGNYRMDCFQFEQSRPLYKYKTSFVRRIVVDKQTLVPIEVVSYNHNVPERTYNIHPAQGKNYLTFRRRLIAIND